MKKIIALTLVLLSSATATETTSINRDVANGWGEREMVMTHTRRFAAQKSAEALVSAWRRLGLAQPESSLDRFEATLNSSEFTNDQVRSLFKRGPHRNYIEDALTVLPNLRQQNFSEPINNQQYSMVTITTMVMDIIKHYDHYTNNKSRLEIDRDLLQQNLIKNIGDMREDDGHVVCNIGMSQRIMRTLQGYLDGVGIDGLFMFGASENVPDTDTFADEYNTTLSNAIGRQADGAIFKGIMTFEITEITPSQQAIILINLQRVQDSWLDGTARIYRASEGQRDLAIQKIKAKTKQLVDFVTSVNLTEDPDTLNTALYGDQQDTSLQKQAQELLEQQQRLYQQERRARQAELDQLQNQARTIDELRRQTTRDQVQTSQINADIERLQQELQRQQNLIRTAQAERESRQAAENRRQELQRQASQLRQQTLMIEERHRYQNIADILDQVEAASQDWTPEQAKQAAKILESAVDMFKNHPDNVKQTKDRSSTQKSNTRPNVSIPEAFHLYALKFVRLGSNLLGYASANNVPIPDNFRANKSKFIQSAAGLSFDQTVSIAKNTQLIKKERKITDRCSVAPRSASRQRAPELAPLPSMAEPAPEFDITHARFMSLDGQPIPDDLARDIERLVVNPENNDAITQMRQALTAQRLIETQQAQSSDYPEISLKLENTKTELTGLTQSPTQDQANKIAYGLHNLAVDFMNTSDRSEPTFKTLVAEWRSMKQQLDSVLQQNQWTLPKGVLGNPLKFMEKDVSKWDSRTMTYKNPETQKSRRGDDRSRAAPPHQDTRMEEFDDTRSVISQSEVDNPALDPDDIPQQIENRPESLPPSETSSTSAQDNLAPLMSELSDIETQVASVPDRATAEALATQLVNFSQDKLKNEGIISIPGITQITAKWRQLANDLNARIMTLGGKTNAKLAGNPSKFVDKISEPGAGKSKRR